MSSNSNSSDNTYPYSSSNSIYYQHYYNTPPPPIYNTNQNSWTSQAREELRNQEHQQSSSSGTANSGNSKSNSVSNTGTRTSASDSRTSSRSDPRVSYYNVGRQYPKYPQSYANPGTYDRRPPYATSTDYANAMVPAGYALNPAAFNAAYPPPLPPPPPPPPSYTSSLPNNASSHNHTSAHADASSHSTRNHHSYPARAHSQTTVPRLSQHGQGHAGNMYDYYQRKRRNSTELDKGMGKKKKKPLSQNIPSRKDWSVEEARKALDVEKEFNKRHKSQSLIIKFPDLELNRDIVSKFHPGIDSVHFQQPSTPRFCFITLNNKVSADEVISDLNKVKFGDGYLIAEHKKDREDEISIGPEDIDPLTLYVGNLAQEVTKDDILKAYPKQKRIDIGFAKKMKYTRYAFVSFRSVKDAIDAFQHTHATEMYSKSLIVRFRRLHGTVGMPGEPKSQNPTKKLDRTMDDSNTSHNGVEVDLVNSVDDNEEDSNSYFNTSEVDRSIGSTNTQTNHRVSKSSRSNSFSVEDLIAFGAPTDDSSAQDNLCNSTRVKREPDSDSEEDSVTPFYNSVDTAILHRPKVKSEVKEEREEDFSEDDLDNDEDEPLPQMFSEIARSPIRPSIEPLSIPSEPPRLSAERIRVAEPVRAESEPLKVSREPSKPVRVISESSVVTSSLSSSGATEKTVANTEEKDQEEEMELIHRPMLLPKVESFEEHNVPVDCFEKELEIKKEMIDDVPCDGVESSEARKIHRPMLEPKSEVEVKQEEEDDSDDSDMESDNFSFNSLLKKMDKPKVTL